MKLFDETDLDWISDMVDVVERAAGQPWRVALERLDDARRFAQPTAPRRFATVVGAVQRILGGAARNRKLARATRMVALGKPVFSAAEREARIAAAADALAVTNAAVERLLWADLPRERPIELPMGRPNELEIAALANVQLLQRAVCRAHAIKIRIWGDGGTVIRAAAARGLLLTVSMPQQPDVIALQSTIDEARHVATADIDDARHVATADIDDEPRRRVARHVATADIDDARHVATADIDDARHVPTADNEPRRRVARHVAPAAIDDVRQVATNDNESRRRQARRIATAGIDDARHVVTDDNESHRRDARHVVTADIEDARHVPTADNEPHRRDARHVATANIDDARYVGTADIDDARHDATADNEPRRHDARHLATANINDAPHLATADIEPRRRDTRYVATTNIDDARHVAAAAIDDAPNPDATSTPLAARAPAELTVLDIVGPLALCHRTSVYGRALAGLVPLLADCTRFELDIYATAWTQPQPYHLHCASPVLLPAVPARLVATSGVVVRLARDILRARPELDVVTCPAPIASGTTLVCPDLAIQCGARIRYIELVGFWTNEFLERKLARYRRAGLDVRLCLDEARGGADDDPPRDPRIVRYVRRLEAEEVIDGL